GLHCLVKGRVQTYSFQRGLPKAQVIRVDADFHGNLWIQTRGAGVVKAAGEKLKLYTMQEGLPSDDVEGCFLEDREGNIWFGKMGVGSNVYRIRDGRHKHVSIFAVVRLYEDSEGSIWIATLMGLYRARKLAITLLTERDGLSHNWVYPILQGRGKEVW